MKRSISEARLAEKRSESERDLQSEMNLTYRQMPSPLPISERAFKDEVFGDDDEDEQVAQKALQTLSRAHKDAQSAVAAAAPAEQ